MRGPHALKRILPTSLFWRAFMILVIPILTLQVIVGTLFVQRLYDGVTEQMTAAVVRDVETVIERVDGAPDPATARARIAALDWQLGFEMTLDPGGRVTPETRRALYDLTAGVIAATFTRLIERPMRLDFLRHEKRLALEVGTAHGVLQMVIPRGVLNVSNPHQFVVWMVVSALVLTGMATVFLRNQIRPIGDLARAASAFGRGRHVPFRPRGAEEVRRAGHAFLDIRARIERHIGQRTLMLSGVSHDLRTPLTRIRLALAVLEPSTEAEEIARDAAEMERMLDAFLDFVRGEGGESPEIVDPIRLAEEVAGEMARNGQRVQCLSRIEDAAERGIALRPVAIRRCLSNLVENALRHGQTVRLTTRLTRRGLDFTVEDDGPGIAPERREEALRPFTRLDASRNQDDGPGVGLGLSIALDIARSHGGSLTLERSADLGGLRVEVNLPR